MATRQLAHGTIQCNTPPATRLKRAKDAFEARMDQRRERKAAERLGTGKDDSFRPIVSELAGLMKQDPALAKAYLNEAKKVLAEATDFDYSTDMLRTLLAWDVRRKARDAVYEKIGLDIVPPLPIQIRYGLKPIDERDSFFTMAVHGRLRENILKIANVSGSARVEIEAISGATGAVYKAKVRHEDGEASVYVKESGLEADMLGATMLRQVGFIVPNVINVRYRAGDIETEYGVMQDIANADGVKRIVSIRALARDEGLANYVLSNWDEFGEKLGRAYETCRMLGIQDMHDRNLFLAEMENGKKKIGMIDVGFVACYSEEEPGQKAYAGQLRHVIKSLDFADRYGELVRSAPASVWPAISSEDKKMAAAYRTIITNNIADDFIKGALEAHRWIMKNTDFVRLQLQQNHGKPVGYEADDRDKTSYNINGKIQQLIIEGPNKGRFFLDWFDAWKNGFLQHAKTDVKAFWGGVLGTVQEHRYDTWTMVY